MKYKEFSVGDEVWVTMLRRASTEGKDMEI